MQKRFGNNFRHQLYGATVDSSGNVYIVGDGGTRTDGTSFDGIFFAKINSSGTVQWEQTLGGDTSTNNTEWSKYNIG